MDIVQKKMLADCVRPVLIALVVYPSSRRDSPLVLPYLMMPICSH